MRPRQPGGARRSHRARGAKRRHAKAEQKRHLLLGMADRRAARQRRAWKRRHAGSAGHIAVREARVPGFVMLDRRWVPGQFMALLHDEGDWQDD